MPTCENEAADRNARPSLNPEKRLMPDQDERPATKHDLDQLEARLVENMRDMQTEVLRAFHNWARPAEIKLRSHEERLTLLEERISEIERGKPS
jgi:hypothetical protein